MKDPLKGFLYSLAGVVLVSTNFVTAKFGLSGFNPETFSFVWTAAATLYSFLICLFFKESRAFSPVIYWSYNSNNNATLLDWTFTT